jgi:hypothetical protein
LFFFCTDASFHRTTERIELNGGRSVALRLMRRPVRTPRSSLHVRWLLLGARLGVWVVTLVVVEVVVVVAGLPHDAVGDLVMVRLAVMVQ